MSLADKQAALLLWQRVNAEAGYAPAPEVAAGQLDPGPSVPPGHVTPFGW